VYGPYAPTREQQAEALKAQAKWLNEQLEALNQRIAELEGEE
jgi:prefoldin subunit 5